MSGCSMPAEFNTLAAAGALPAPGQFLASAQSSDFLSNPLTEVTQFRRPAVRYQGDYNWGAGQRLSVGYDWERETNPDVTGFDLDNNAVFAQHQSTFANRWFLTVGARVDSKESYDTYVSPKLSAGGFVAAVPRRRPVVGQVVRQCRPWREVADVHRALRRRRFRGSQPRHQSRAGQVGDLGVEATFADQRLRATATSFGTTSPIRSPIVSDRRETAFPSTSTSTARRRVAWSWSWRCSGRSPD